MGRHRIVSNDGMVILAVHDVIGADEGQVGTGNGNAANVGERRTR